MEETRRRIVQACFDLHGEQGVGATSMKQIAERAGVSVGAVYHHFPTYDDAITACGAHAFSRAPLPSEALFEGVESRAERVRRLAMAIYRVYGEVTAFARVRSEQQQFPVLKPFMDEERRLRHALARAAVDGDAERAATLAALLDAGTYEALRGEGLDVPAAAARIAEIANAWLDARDRRG